MAAAASMNSLEPYQQLDRQVIGGKWRTGRSKRLEVDKDPYNGAPLVEIQLASVADVNAAYEAAQAAQREWANTLPSERAQLMLKVAAILDARHEEIASWLIHESGSTRVKANIEIASARGIVLEAASFPGRVEGRILAAAMPGQDSRVYREPLGVVGVISPWNFPLHLSMRSVAPAIALGNTVVVKPASDTPVTGGLLLAKIFEEAGAPPGLLNVVVGAGSEIGDHFVAQPIPRLISFTGSTAVGRGIGRIASGGEYIKRVALELGGNAPLVVLEDADIDNAAEAAVVGRYLHQGQICMSTNRVIVDARIHDDFLDAVTQRVRALKVGDPNDPQTAIGPIINSQQLDSLLEKIAGAKQDGGREVVGGEVSGSVLPPHLFADVQPQSSIVVDESFGPLLPVVKAKDEAAALELANATQYGLSSAVFTGDYERGVRFARGIVAGMTHVNDTTVDDQPNAPFGGEKNSGLGRFNGEWAIEEFTRAHWITVQYSPHPYPF